MIRRYLLSAICSLRRLHRCFRCNGRIFGFAHFDTESDAVLCR